MIPETRLSLIISKKLADAGVFHWKVEHAIGGTTGAPDMNIWMSDVPGFDHSILAPTELKLFEVGKNGLVLKHVQPDQVDWHMKAAEWELPSIILAFGAIEGQPKLVGLKSIDMAYWRRGINSRRPSIDFDPANINASSLLSLIRATIYQTKVEDE